MALYSCKEDRQDRKDAFVKYPNDVLHYIAVDNIPHRMWNIV